MPHEPTPSVEGARQKRYPSSELRADGLVACEAGVETAADDLPAGDLWLATWPCRLLLLLLLLLLTTVGCFLAACME
eukprot:COSAG02_NODE_1638_length_11542_cov_13.473739_4_plen_77_part_00